MLTFLELTETHRGAPRPAQALLCHSERSFREDALLRSPKARRDSRTAKHGDAPTNDRSFAVLFAMAAFYPGMCCPQRILPSQSGNGFGRPWRYVCDHTQDSIDRFMPVGHPPMMWGPSSSPVATVGSAALADVAAALPVIRRLSLSHERHDCGPGSSAARSARDSMK